MRGSKPGREDVPTTHSHLPVMSLFSPYPTMVLGRPFRAATKAACLCIQQERENEILLSIKAERGGYSHPIVSNMRCWFVKEGVWTSRWESKMWS